MKLKTYKVETKMARNCHIDLDVNIVNKKGEVKMNVERPVVATGNIMPMTSSNYRLNKIYQGKNYDKWKELPGDFPTDLNLTTADYMFQYMRSLEHIDLSKLNTKNISSVREMFSGCQSLQEIDLSPLAEKPLTNIKGLFSNCLSLKTIDLSVLDTSKCTDITALFNYNTCLESVNFTNCDFSNVTTASSLFSGCEKLKEVDLSTVKANKLKSISFSGLTNATSIKLPAMTEGSLFGSTGISFNGCASIEEIDLHEYPAKITNGNFLFSGCKKARMIDISSWDTSGMKNCTSMFRDCENLEEVRGVIDLGQASVTGLTSMFQNVPKLKGLKVRNVPTDWTTHDETTGLNKYKLRADQYEIVD